MKTYSVHIIHYRTYRTPPWWNISHKSQDMKKLVSVPLLEVNWSIFINGKQGISPNKIVLHYHSPKSTHQGKLQTKTWSGFLHHIQEDPSHVCNQDYNTNKGCCIPTDTYLSIFSLPDHPGYLVIWATLPWDHPLWCDDLHLSGAYVCFHTQGRLFYLPKTYFKRTIAHNLCMLIYQNLQYSSLFPEIWQQYFLVLNVDGSRF